MAERQSQSNTATNDGPPAVENEPHPGPTRQDGSHDSATKEEWYSVTFSVPWIVRGADTGQDAINIAVSEVGKRITSAGDRTRNCNINVQSLGCNNCNSRTDALLLVSNTALVGLLVTLEIKAASDEEAERIARREIGPHLEDTPLTSVDISRM
ncbi:DUF555 domain-containing protein [Natrinema caseinilyticum]|uniref:DUF555 domain-containing protein n=1 Tax=Natrinema caseinilyticum TaxID=2961570 RepID=UPI0020C40F3D|nr:DUF555 domain-containing protein [Natrinema caseinilyticum]